jgi:hypothetical protein
MLKRIVKLTALLAVVVPLFTGCAVNRATATLDPSANLEAIKSMHVVQIPGSDGIVSNLIVDKLRSKGYTVTTSTEKTTQTDAVVTYLDKWMWDITMYMLELTITIRDPQTDYPLASGNSYHTSLTRKSPTEMVDEVIENIFKQKKEQ